MKAVFADQRETEPRYAGRHPMRPHPGGNGHSVGIPDGELFYAPAFFSRAISGRVMEKLLANDRYPVAGTDWEAADLTGVHWRTIQWRQDFLNMYGREVALPRLTAWHGDPDRCYTYSGLTLWPQPWNTVLAWLRDRLRDHTGIRFNSVLLNWYRGGNDHMSWHADDEPELGHNPTIASVNFGISRRFILRRNDDRQHKIEFPLGHGSLLVMSGATQHHWQHSVPRQKRVRGSRINLTFRVIHKS